MCLCVNRCIDHELAQFARQRSTRQLQVAVLFLPCWSLLRRRRGNQAPVALTIGFPSLAQVTPPLDPAHLLLSPFR
ncbi:hypothetical protein PF008_g24761 [Phytophthora fragariae]|uniref:Uncharacterized protein n=1 Tax=Phytophthora fragariae TaxID=53985 RepID=A0A6G0QLY7_9STRA|nr:hypothetical protein PF008_g24761 [Phytophthora fragariae]